MFFIHAMVAPLNEVLGLEHTRSVQLREPLNAMSVAVVAYRDMSLVPERELA